MGNAYLNGEIILPVQHNEPMKQYPTIDRQIQRGIKAYVFDKLDGSHIRAEWNRKNGFYKFGSRKRLVGTDQLFLPEAESLIRKAEDELIKVFKKQRYEKVICFLEFWGKNSFAGKHIEEPHFITLIDVNPHKKGILLPKEFLKLFSHLDITAKLLYHGNINQPFIDLVKENKLEGITMEGVVCKTLPSKKGYPPTMFKIKTKAWIQKLKEYCKGNEKLFNELL